jgi:hypothetical protein
MARVRRDSVRVTSVDRPGWAADSGRIPLVGEVVQCTDGEAEVMKVLTRLSDGGRLLELRLPDRPKTPFFAASSNVMLREAGPKR